MLLKKHLFLAIAVLCTLASLAFASPNEVNELQAPHDATNAVSCGSCHVPYNTVPQPVPANWLSNTICKSCHIAGGVASAMTEHTSPSGTVWCQTCHDPHAQPNVYQRWFVKNNMNTPNSGNRPSVIRDSLDFMHGATGVTQAFDGVCETCHTTTAVFRNNLSGAHPTAANLAHHEGSNKCTNCHRHENGFMATRSYTGCTTCHDGVVNDSSFEMAGRNLLSSFDTTRPHFHPVLASGRNGTIQANENNPSIAKKMLVTPSWLSTTPPLSHNSRISCTDCHGDTTSGGLHGQGYSFLERDGVTVLQANLKAHLELGNHQEAGPRYDLVANALCYACHDSVYYRNRGTSVVSGVQTYYRFDPAFPGDTTRYQQVDSNRWSNHYRHVLHQTANTQERQEACLTCHGVHGGATAAQEAAGGRWGLVRWSKQATGLVIPGMTRPDSITNPDSTLRINRVIVGGDTIVQQHDSSLGKSVLFGYYRFTNKVGTSIWALRDTALVGRDTVIAFCYVNCHTLKDSTNWSYPNNHMGRTVRYRVAR